MNNYFSNERGKSGNPLNNVMRYYKPEEFDPILDAISCHGCLMYQARLKGTELDLDNWTVYTDLKNAILGESAYI